MTAQTEVLVIGGGYAGVMAANRLTQRDDVAVTLVNPRPTFVDRIRLHQLVAGTHDPVVDYRTVLAGGVRLVVDTVTRIDAAGRGDGAAAHRGGAAGTDPGGVRQPVHQPGPSRRDLPGRGPRRRRQAGVRGRVGGCAAQGADLPGHPLAAGA